MTIRAKERKKRRAFRNLILSSWAAEKNMIHWTGWRKCRIWDIFSVISYTDNQRSAFLLRERKSSLFLAADIFDCESIQMICQLRFWLLINPLRLRKFYESSWEQKRYETVKQPGDSKGTKLHRYVAQAGVRAGESKPLWWVLLKWGAEECLTFNMIVWVKVGGRWWCQSQ